MAAATSTAAIEISHLRKQLGDALRSGAEAAARCADAEAALASVRGRAERLATEVESLVRERREREEAHRAHSEASSAAAASDLERERSAWRVRVSEAERGVEEACRREEWAKGEAAALRSKLGALEGEWVAAQAGAREAKAAAAASRSEAASLAGKLEVLDATLGATSAQASSAERGAGAFRAAAAEAEAALASTRASLAGARSECMELKGRVEGLTGECARLRALVGEATEGSVRG